MFEVTIRKEKYGFLIFVPSRQSYYRIYDKHISQSINKMIENNNKNIFKDNYYYYYKKFDLDKYNYRYIDNTKFDKNVFVPLEAYFDYTAICNKKCSYCYNKNYVGNITMPERKVRKIFDDLYELGIMRVHLAGGEPTIDYNGLKNYIEYGRKKGMCISMATNGTILTDEVCELLTSNDLFSVSISLDSCDEKENDKTRGKGSFKEAIEGLNNLKEYKAKNKSNLKICLKPVYTPNITEGEIRKNIEFAEKNNIDILKFANPERCENHDKGFYGKQREEYYKCLQMIQNIIEEKDRSLKITNASNPFLYDFIIGIEENKGCIGGQELLTINPDGRITPCLMNHTLLGNIYDYDSISSYLKESENLRKYVKKISNYQCKSCELHSSCRGGCQVRKKVEYGDIKDVDPLCPNNKAKSKVRKKEYDVRKINIYHSL